MQRRELHKALLAPAGLSLFLPAASFARRRSSSLQRTPGKPLIESVWKTRAPLPISVQEIYPTVWQGQIVVAGGIAARMGVPYFTNRVFTYDPAIDERDELPRLPEDLHHVALAVVDGALYALGGFNGGYSHVWRMRDTVYRLAEDTWEVVDTLPKPQAEGIVAPLNRRLHVVSGQSLKGQANKDRSDHREIADHWVWDGEWHDLAPIPTPRNSATGG